MAAHFHRPPQQRGRLAWWSRMDWRNRVLLVLVLAGMLVASGLLLYFQPSAPPADPADPSNHLLIGTGQSVYPPGTRYYYRRSQWQGPDPEQQVQP